MKYQTFVKRPIVLTLDKFWLSRTKGFQPKFYIMCKDCKQLKDVGPYLVESYEKKRRYCEDCI